jgi:hypothetical protein
MPKVRNIASGIYADGVIYVAPGEVIEVSEDKAEYLCAGDTAGRFERVVEPKHEPKGKAK